MKIKLIFLFMVLLLLLGCNEEDGDDNYYFICESDIHYDTVYIGDSHCRNGVEFEGKNFGKSGLILDQVQSPSDYGCPQVTYFLIGSVDIRRLGGWNYTVQETIANYKEVLDDFMRNGSEVNIIGVFPINKAKIGPRMGWSDTWMDQYNIDLEELNEELKLLAEEFGVDFYNLWDDLVDGVGELNTIYTDDGCHLNTLAYETIVYPILYD